jgi:hypothetical protein
VLDISVDDVNTALTRVLHLGLLHMIDQETWLDLSGNAYARFNWKRSPKIEPDVHRKLSHLVAKNNAS